jgi:hypothetical protein
MISDSEIKTKGIKALIGALGPTETGRFLRLIDRQPADYTEWRHLLFEGMSTEEINAAATKLWREREEEETVS